MGELVWWWAFAVLAAVVVFLLAAAFVRTDTGEDGRGVRGFVDDVRAGLRTMFRRGDADDVVLPRPTRAEARAQETSLDAFLDATQVDAPAYVDAGQITETLVNARDRAARTLHVHIGRVNAPDVAPEYASPADVAPDHMTADGAPAAPGPAASGKTASGKTASGKTAFGMTAPGTSATGPATVPSSGAKDAGGSADRGSRTARVVPVRTTPRSANATDATHAGPASSGTAPSGTPSSGTPTSSTPTSGTPTSGTPSSGTDLAPEPGDSSIVVDRSPEPPWFSREPRPSSSIPVVFAPVHPPQDATRDDVA
ncbi:hypothetical protein CLV28_2784 [Sediminihabitans luteus]|uniref:Uncharacterized protein n=1 Tax=Sediminihabitans luteus TaxID=1138585 RepID=A0A2M9CC68_9CELL|nr:hypothetical protein [Sediminihabitans luteus]PJJ68977.1 hypothetical protein CLV28_2784 [Sediminihabitans luteus]